MAAIKYFQKYKSDNKNFHKNHVKLYAVYKKIAKLFIQIQRK